MTQEILPPVHYSETGPATASDPQLPAAGPGRPLGPGSRVPSGHWWVFIEGPAGALKSVSVNGAMFYLPLGEWCVVDNTHFTVARNSYLRMNWIDGQDEWEKTFGPNGAMGERKVDPGMKPAPKDELHKVGWRVSRPLHITREENP